MNVLLLVSTMLTLLSIMTYTRLKTFLDTAGIRIEYEQYMTHAEREEIDDLEIEKYKNTKAKSGGAGQKLVKDAPEDQEQKERALAFLNLFPMVGNLQNAANTQDSNTLSARGADTLKVFQRLIEILYSNQRFYKEALSKYPQLSDELIKQMMQSIDDAPYKLKFTNKKDLAHIPMVDHQMREIFYKMLKGQPASYTTNSNGKRVKTSQGYRSLLDYVTVNKRPSTVRVYLARKALIQAIFRDPDPVIDRRTELYRQIKSDVIKPDGATKDFSGLFKNNVATDIDLSLLDFTVSKSPPPDRSANKFGNPNEPAPSDEEEQEEL